MRNTPQSGMVLRTLAKLGHATNSQLLVAVRPEMPDISATTVHRITNRLLMQKKIGATRVIQDGAIVLDTNPLPHHHFTCAACGELRDTQIPAELIQTLQDQVCKNLLADSLVINGICKKCKEK